MSDLHVVPRGAAATFEEAAKTMSPEVREAVLLITSRAGLAENDPVYALMVAQAELFSHAFEAQTTALKAILEAFVSARSEENVELAKMLDSYRTETAEFTASVKAATEESKTSRKVIETSIHSIPKATGKEKLLQTLGSVLIAGALLVAFVIGLVVSPILRTLMGWGS